MDEEQKEEETLSIGLFSCFREFYTSKTPSKYSTSYQFTIDKKRVKFSL